MKATRVLVRPEAESDLLAAYGWYEEQSRGLGEVFLASVKESLDLLAKNPEAFQVIHRSIRRILIRRFPYGIFYIPQNDGISILAVLHVRRDPKILKARKV